MNELMRTKSVAQSLNDTQEEDRSLKRTLTAWDLMVLGIAVAVGAGIFSVGAKIASGYAGPAVIISFIIAAITCGLAILCYAEFASTLPVAGSAYTYTYASLGEFLAWIIGWDLILELFAAAALISKYWGVYLSTALRSFNIDIQTQIHFGGITFDWAPLLIIGVFTTLLIAGTKLSTQVGNIFTVIKVVITLVVIFVGFLYFQVANLHPFVPLAENIEETGQTWKETTLFSTIIGTAPAHFGVLGIIAGASVAFFAFIGFDVVATSAEETKNPQKTIVRGIFSGLAVVTILYLLVAISMVGMVPYKYLSKGQPDAAAIKEMPSTNPDIAKHLNSLSPGQLEQLQNADPSLTKGFEIIGAPTWVISLIALGILVGLTTVIMVLLMGLSRVVLAISRDGLLPRWLSKTSEKTKTPVRLQIIAGVAVAFVACFFDVDFLEGLINIGTLSAFVLVSIGVVVLRYRQPDLPRSFKVPFFPVLPIISALACFYLMLNLNNISWVRFGIWLLIGIIIYFSYGYRNSLIRKTAITGAEPEAVDIVQSLGISNDYSNAGSGVDTTQSKSQNKKQKEEKDH